MKKLSDFSVLFDLDGTLVNSLPDIVGVVNITRRHWELPALSPAEVKRHIGHGATNLLRGCFAGVQEEEFPKIHDFFHGTYVEEPFCGGSLYPGVLETLTKLRELGIVLAIATNKPIAAARKTLEYYLPNFSFAEVAGPECVSKKKPAKEHLTEVLARLGQSPEMAWFVGDDPVDQTAAHAAGVGFFAATYGFGGVSTGTSCDLKQFSDLWTKLPFLGSDA